MENCSTCSTPLTTAQVLYTPDAKVICAACNEKVDLVDTDKRAARNIVRSASSALAAGALSIPLFLFIMGLAAYAAIAVSIIGGVFALKSMQRKNDRFTKHLTSGQSTYVYIATVLGFTFCLATVMMVLLLGTAMAVSG